MTTTLDQPMFFMEFSGDNLQSVIDQVKNFAKDSKATVKSLNISSGLARFYVSIGYVFDNHPYPINIIFPLDSKNDLQNNFQTIQQNHQIISHCAFEADDGYYYGFLVRPKDYSANIKFRKQLYRTPDKDGFSDFCIICERTFGFNRYSERVVKCCCACKDHPSKENYYQHGYCRECCPDHKDTWEDY